jgi:hypothetical protein
MLQARRVMRIRTEHVYPPIPRRDWDWAAYDADNYEPGMAVGEGPTEFATIVDFLLQFEAE